MNRLVTSICIRIRSVCLFDTHLEFYSGKSRCDGVIFEFLIVKNENKSIDRSDSISIRIQVILFSIVKLVVYGSPKAIHASEIAFIMVNVRKEQCTVSRSSIFSI